MVSVLGNRTGHAPLATESLTVALSHCVHRWTIGTDRDTLPVIGTPGIGWTRLAGVGFNRIPRRYCPRACGVRVCLTDSH